MPKKATPILLDSLKGKVTPPLKPYLGRKKRWEKDDDEEGKKNEESKKR